MIERVASRFYQASLFTLPWIGVGVIMLGSGRDLGGGLQPSWLLLALATVVAILAWSRGRTVFGHRFSRMLVLACGMLSAALALSL